MTLCMGVDVNLNAISLSYYLCSGHSPSERARTVQVYVNVSAPYAVDNTGSYLGASQF